MSQQSDYLERALIERYRVAGTVLTREGIEVEDYIDLRSAVLNQFDQPTIIAFFIWQLRPHIVKDLIIGTGPFGAAVSALLAFRGFRCAIWNPKGHGVQWSGRDDIKTAVFIDDVISTGATIAEVQAAAAAKGITIVRTVVGWDRRLD